MQAFVITLREGLEAFLIVAISIAYLRKSQRYELVSAVRWGIAGRIIVAWVVTIPACIILGWVIYYLLHLITGVR